MSQNTVLACTTLNRDLILKSIYYHSSGLRFDYTPSTNKKEEELLKNIHEIITKFRIDHGHTLKSFLIGLEISIETVNGILSGIAAELFSEGITWNRIIAFFAFVGELTLLCLSKELSKHVTKLIYECFSTFVKENLEKWILDHGGWNGILTVSSVVKKTSNQGWMDKFFYELEHFFDV